MCSTHGRGCDLLDTHSGAVTVHISRSQVGPVRAGQVDAMNAALAEAGNDAAQLVAIPARVTQLGNLIEVLDRDPDFPVLSLAYLLPGG